MWEAFVSLYLVYMCGHVHVSVYLPSYTCVGGCISVYVSVLSVYICGGLCEYICVCVFVYIHMCGHMYVSGCVTVCVAVCVPPVVLLAYTGARGWIPSVVIDSAEKGPCCSLAARPEVWLHCVS